MAMNLRSPLVCCLVAAFAVPAWGQSAGESRFDLERSAAVHEPQLERRKVKVPRIDSEDFELGTYMGVMGVEDFGASPVGGFRLALHVTESWFLEGAMGRASVSDSSFRQLGIPVFENETQDLSYRYYSVGYNLFPGEVFIGSKLAFTSSAYFSAGVGTTRFEDDDWFTMVFGMGVRLLPTDWLSLHFDARAHEFDGSLLGKNKFSHNIEAHAGIGVFF